MTDQLPPIPACIAERHKHWAHYGTINQDFDHQRGPSPWAAYARLDMAVSANDLQQITIIGSSIIDMARAYGWSVGAVGAIRAVGAIPAAVMLSSEYVDHIHSSIVQIHGLAYAYSPATRDAAKWVEDAKKAIHEGMENYIAERGVAPPAPVDFTLRDWRINNEGEDLFKEEAGQSVDHRRAEAKIKIERGGSDGLVVSATLPDGRRADVYLEMDLGCLRVLGYLPRSDKDGPEGKATGLMHDEPLFRAHIGPTGTVVTIGSEEMLNTISGVIHTDNDEPRLERLNMGDHVLYQTIDKQKAEGIKILQGLSSPDEIKAQGPEMASEPEA